MLWACSRYLGGKIQSDIVYFRKMGHIVVMMMCVLSSQHSVARTIHVSIKSISSVVVLNCYMSSTILI